MNTFLDRIADLSAETQDLYLKLYDAAAMDGWDNGTQIEDALAWVAIQLDPEEDDYETWETTLLARLENPNEGER